MFRKLHSAPCDNSNVSNNLYSSNLWFLMRLFPEIPPHTDFIIFRLLITTGMISIQRFVRYYRFESHAIFTQLLSFDKSSRPEVFLRKGVLEIFSKFTGEYPCRSAISIKLESNVKSTYNHLESFSPKQLHLKSISNNRSSHQRRSVKKVFLKIAKIHRKSLCKRLFTKVAALM